MKRCYVYIMTNAPSGTLYTGVTAYIAARVNQHRSVAGSDFCKRHGLTRLVLVATYDTIERSEEHTSELQSLMRISYAVFCLKKKKSQKTQNKHHVNNDTKNHIQSQIRDRSDATKKTQ